MTCLHRILPLVAVSLAAIACSSESDGEGDAVLPGQDDHDQLLECSGDRPCNDRAFAQRIEGGSPFSMFEVECLLVALRDRTPSVLQMELNHGYTNGAELWSHVLVVTESGEVETSVDHSNSSASDPEGTRDFGPARRCTLQPPDYFEACLAEVQDLASGGGGGVVDTPEHPAWACVFPGLDEDLPWFASCEEQAPTCE